MTQSTRLKLLAVVALLALLAATYWLLRETGALATILDRAALHSQLAAAVQVVLHVARDRTGQRRLAEIGLLQRAGDGLVQVIPCWHHATGSGYGAERLRDLLRAGGRA